MSEPVDRGPKAVGELFEREPFQWGLRGDPLVWRAMQDRLAVVDMPESVFELDDLLRDTFRAVVGEDVNNLDIDVLHREQFEAGGMSSGQIPFSAWRERLIPILIDRSRLS
ncbi:MULTISPECIES: hypothetical protein [Nocardioides]|uniref:hypothetical protein n=1 Tax=Nocardioides TaxID=1839 RepID=UPI000568C64B|nr:MULTISPECIES: hypothetical protein [Nocardioides]